MKAEYPNKLIYPIYLNRIGFDTGLMKVTILFPCNAGEANVTIVYQSSEIKVPNQGTFEIFAFRGYALRPVAISFTNGSPPPCHISAGCTGFCRFACFLYALKRTRIRYARPRLCATKAVRGQCYRNGVKEMQS